MPVLDWVGKKAVVNHHREVPYRLTDVLDRIADHKITRLDELMRWRYAAQAE